MENKNKNMPTKMRILASLVKEEASLLKENATKTELKRLDFKLLYAHSPSRCIYGQMTGSCWSKRAEKLIKKCCTTVVNVYTNKYINVGTINREAYFSPIETFLLEEEDKSSGFGMDLKNSERIIDFLKGKTQTLTFTGIK